MIHVRFMIYVLLQFSRNKEIIFHILLFLTSIIMPETCRLTWAKQLISVYTQYRHAKIKCVSRRTRCTSQSPPPQPLLLRFFSQACYLPSAGLLFLMIWPFYRTVGLVEMRQNVRVGRKVYFIYLLFNGTYIWCYMQLKPLC